MSRMTRRGFLAAGALALTHPHSPWVPDFLRRQVRPAPSHPQLEWQRDELALFLHFGVNTFTDREWGDGREDPAIFVPAALDALQWARVAKAGGFRAMILTAKHHDGFCLWPTRTTRHSVESSPWRGGKGDVVREFTEACHAEGLKAGLYLSPWDRNHPAYGDSPRYNDIYCDQLTELLTRYGSIHEVWFDGANGEGPNGKRQEYDWPRFWGLVRRLQPQAVIFSDAGPDLRWIGNESGVAGETNWSTVDPAAVPYPGASGQSVLHALQEGAPDGSVWRPGETDVSIRPGWFHHPGEDGRVKTVEELVEIYFTSVGRNSKLLLNVPPSRDGLIHQADANRLVELRRRLEALFTRNLARRRPVTWSTTRPKSLLAELDLGRTMRVAMSDLREDIRHGQLVTRYTLEGSDGGAWTTLAHGTTVGNRKLDRFEPLMVRRVRLRLEEVVDWPKPVRIGLYRGADE